MKYYQLAPALMILLQVVSALGYLHAGDHRRAVYWTAGAVLTWSVTW